MALHLFTAWHGCLGRRLAGRGPGCEGVSPGLPRIAALPGGGSPRDARVGALAPPLRTRVVLSPGLSADVPLPPPRRAIAGTVPKGIRQRDRRQQHRERGHGDRHVDAPAAQPRRAVAAASRPGCPLVDGLHALPDSFANTWPTPRARRMAAKAMSIMAMRPHGGFP